MNSLFEVAAHNTVVALVLAMFVYAVTRVWRNPPAAHLLWLLVLLKLVAPPLVGIDGSASRAPVAGVPGIEEREADSRFRFANQPATQTTLQALEPSLTGHGLAGGIQRFWNRARPVALWCWLGGAAWCALVAARRIARFERLLRGTPPASQRLRLLTIEIAEKLGVRRVPDVRCVDCVAVPFLWCAGRRPMIVLPMRLVSQLDDQRLALILAHEFAHLRRRDHWVRAVELFISTVYWWNPLVCLIRRQIHQAEDLCCDAWVRWAFPECAKRYAEVLLQTAESLSASQAGARSLPASPFLRSPSLKARIEMILESRFAPRVSPKSLLAIALLALLVLPCFVQTAQTATADKKSEAPTTSEFPYAVRFDQGAARFLNGDKITIRAAERSRSFFRCRTEVGRTSVSTRPTAEKVLAATISGRATRR